MSLHQSRHTIQYLPPKVMKMPTLMIQKTKKICSTDSLIQQTCHVMSLETSKWRCFGVPDTEMTKNEKAGSLPLNIRVMKRWVAKWTITIQPDITIMRIQGALKVATKFVGDIREGYREDLKFFKLL